MRRGATASLVAVVLALFACFVPAGAADKPPAQQGTSEGLRAVMMAYYQAMASDKAEDQAAALKSILPVKEDIEALFPQHAATLWPQFEKYVALMLEHASDVAKEVSAHGKVTDVKTVDMRKEDSSGRYQEVLPMIPKDIPVYRIVTQYENASAGSSSYLFIRGRWVLIRGLEGIPKFLKNPEGESKGPK
jgi:hypothetical protein